MTEPTVPEFPGPIGAAGVIRDGQVTITDATAEWAAAHDINPDRDAADAEYIDHLEREAGA